MINLSMEVLRQKKAHLDRLYYEMNNQRDFYLAIMTRKDGLTKCSKWRPYSVICFPINHDGTAEDSRAQWFFSRVNNRTILPCEVVLDGESMDSYQAVIELLNLKGWGYYAYETGSRGFHVHIFFEGDLSSQEKSKIIAEFGTDPQKANPRTMIALESCGHWKTGRAKAQIGGEKID